MLLRGRNICYNAPKQGTYMQALRLDLSDFETTSDWVCAMNVRTSSKLRCANTRKQRAWLQKILLSFSRWGNWLCVSSSFLSWSMHSYRFSLFIRAITRRAFCSARYMSKKTNWKRPFVSVVMLPDLHTNPAVQQMYRRLHARLGR